MLRRLFLTSAVAPRRCACTAMAALGAASRFNTTAASPPQQQQQQLGRTQTNRRQFLTHDQRQNLPPAFDLVRFNETDASKGYMLRIQYVNEAVVLVYSKQNATQSTTQNSGDRRRAFVQSASVGLPSTYVARLLAVMDGNLPSCTVTSRMTRGTFALGASPNSYVLDCTTTNSGEAAVKWTVDIDVPNALLLHRFLTLALQHMQGFYK